MRAEIIRCKKGFYNLKEDWEALEKEDENLSYFNTFEYNYHWLNNSGIVDDNIYVIVIKDKREAILGIAPLYIKVERKVLSLKTLAFMGWGDYLNIILKSKDVNKTKVFNFILENILSETTLWNRVSLQNISIDTDLARVILKHQNYNKNFKLQVENPKINFWKYKNYNDFSLKNISKSTKNQRNKMKREIEYLFKVEKNHEINRYVEIKDTHTKLQMNMIKNDGRKDRRTLFQIETKGKFLEDLYNSSKNIINFLLLDKENKIIAYDSCYIYNDILYSWNIAHDFKYNKYRPGRVIKHEIMNYCFENNIKSYDFGCGRYPWKFEWTPEMNYVYKLEIWNNSDKKSRLLKSMFKFKEALKCLK
ncbi:hypothetical protein PM10SUCC1_24320 [Propionigenium maris DSM 9537]|uniref:BioF2-like acetyltransferase domain-containing protein n=1 Tax=Propionigenium maris DSM 9537 TaxID=1123000 RepID=A0A9W6GKR4_9FUSO|nr:GNAT family N-acetyltransferase [Propionigenium maris]GLI56918.1 hypothetical protein PM10SUCC1_24320 [Propionigenium maris DSM 9537]